MGGRRKLSNFMFCLLVLRTFLIMYSIAFIFKSQQGLWALFGFHLYNISFKMKKNGF